MKGLKQGEPKIHDTEAPGEILDYLATVMVEEWPLSGVFTHLIRGSLTWYKIQNLNMKLLLLTSL